MDGEAGWWTTSGNIGLPSPARDMGVDAVVVELGKGETGKSLFMCGGGLHSIFLLPLVTRCIETIDVCIWRMFVFMFVVVTVWGSVGMFVV